MMSPPFSPPLPTPADLMWFHCTTLLGCLAVIALVNAVPYKITRNSLDLVELMEYEARAKGIPLTKDLHPSPASGKSWDWEWCDDIDAQRYLMDIEAAELYPDPPIMGSNLTFHGVGSLRGLVTKGSYLDVSAYLGFLRVYAERMDLCEVLNGNNVQVQCPVEPGHYDITHVVEIPDGRVPPIPFRFKVMGMSQDNKLIACISGRIKIHNSFTAWTRWFQFVWQSLTWLR